MKHFSHPGGHGTHSKMLNKAFAKKGATHKAPAMPKMQMPPMPMTPSPAPAPMAAPAGMPSPMGGAPGM